MTKAASRILLVDDDDSYRYAAKKLLTEAGFEVTAAPDYRQALDVINGDAPLDLLLTDVVMPNRVNGFALARMAKMRRMSLPVLYMTAFDVPTNEAMGKILRKPIADELLLAEVKEALAA
jgi:CheY-like chemotaxis protein